MFLGQIILFMLNIYIGLVIGLVLFIIGNGFFKLNIFMFVGCFYWEGDDKCDLVFFIFYMGINFGVFFVLIVVVFLCNEWFVVKGIDLVMGKIVILVYGYKYGFLVVGIGMVFGQVIFNLFVKKYFFIIGMKLGKIIFLEVEVIDDFQENYVFKKLFIKVEKQCIVVIVIFMVFVIFFWVGFEQVGFFMIFYMEDFINRNFFGWLILMEFF